MFSWLPLVQGDLRGPSSKRLEISFFSHPQNEVLFVTQSGNKPYLKPNKLTGPFVERFSQRGRG
jgi:hypothetical protein